MKLNDFNMIFENFGHFVKYNKDKLFRLWYKNEEGSGLGADYVYIIGSISIPNDIMLLVQHYDDTKENNRYPSVDFLRLSEITLAYYEDDQEG